MASNERFTEISSTTLRRTALKKHSKTLFTKTLFGSPLEVLQFQGNTKASRSTWKRSADVCTIGCSLGRKRSLKTSSWTEIPHRAVSRRGRRGRERSVLRYAVLLGDENPEPENRAVTGYYDSVKMNCSLLQN